MALPLQPDPAVSMLRRQKCRLPKGVPAFSGSRYAILAPKEEKHKQSSRQHDFHFRKTAADTEREEGLPSSP